MDSIYLVAFIIIIIIIFIDNLLPSTVVEGYMVSVEWRVNIIWPVIWGARG
jgi:hypothetical protein